MSAGLLAAAEGLITLMGGLTADSGAAVALRVLRAECAVAGTLARPRLVCWVDATLGCCSVLLCAAPLALVTCMPSLSCEDRAAGGRAAAAGASGCLRFEGDRRGAIVGTGH